ncbi:PH domain-containing protein [Mariniblastus sp.]|nr:PH domain-containing protein [Mariniblastus sp.]MDA7909260.1 PH domain-containing protein [bacterium]MDA7906315.1 PH domain-containing protein [Mariniblastus sp.]MDA7925032.1 PH domain-containing protein [Mariniblastus sp.]MDA7925577.1 PH domain-containing protein [Mariniblastus sp.]
MTTDHPTTDAATLSETGRESVNPPELFKKLAPANIRYEQLSRAITATILTVVATIALLIWWLNNGFDTAWLLLLAAASILLVFLFVMAWRWPTISYRHNSWKLDEEGLEIHKGVFWKHQISVPLGRVQHADVSQGPIQRSFGLGTLIIHTAGTQNSSVVLSGLSQTTATELRDQIISQKRGDYVV